MQYLVQWKPFKVINLVQNQSDYNYRLINLLHANTILKVHIEQFET
jgi:hypothetical protein